MNVNSEAFEMDSTSEKPKEGDLYRLIELHGKAFEIRYGYYEDIDRQYDPMEIIRTTSKKLCCVLTRIMRSIKL